MLASRKAVKRKYFTLKSFISILIVGSLLIGVEAEAHEKVVVIPLTKSIETSLVGYAPLTATSPPDRAYHVSPFGYVEDSVTGLVWQQGDSGTEKTWEEAWAYCENLQLPLIAGRTDWRLPNVEELVSIVDYGDSSPAINDAFTYTYSYNRRYWSSTTWPSSDSIHTQNRALSVYVSSGVMAIDEKLTSANKYVRCVRTGTAIAGPHDHYKENGNGTVTDQATGLVWLKDGNCERFHGLDNTGQNGRSWSSANQSCNWLNTNHCGLSDGSRVGDWRLPRIKELQSIMYHGLRGPGINTIALPVSIGYYWSGTIEVGEIDKAWIVDFDFLRSFSESNLDIAPYNVRCVRNGP